MKCWAFGTLNVYPGETFKLCQSVGIFCLESSTNKTNNNNKKPHTQKKKRREGIQRLCGSWFKILCTVREGLHLWYVPETVIMQIIQFKSLSLEPWDIEFLCEDQRDNKLSPDILYRTTNSAVQILCFLYSNSCFFFS